MFSLRPLNDVDHESEEMLMSRAAHGSQGGVLNRAGVRQGGFTAKGGGEVRPGPVTSPIGLLSGLRRVVFEACRGDTQIGSERPSGMFAPGSKERVKIPHYVFGGSLGFNAYAPDAIRPTTARTFELDVRARSR